ncbi:proto-oncogene vav-like isoform X1 [Phyllopteryx taeniolatus]|uniref:proto-oncogene vav-like isoform X1 n=3 Tax=Phyllopteryx taeniolatus TaxID=161469 RepID=UPI002AD3E8AD|nr:proto-oncogene vav-like isoform X1 [Phyllopteryx taeniolatus]XP_061626284.1 proto-oncogene vav-like isoform X1 [Phyllopteryx taeniolatus]XP_061626285.1 proto-oncogene vav-like isoform X1 [Phyllopteryx taeniolatus]XP_061626286.1 proto-oncogene vav-like isoform X1 [Phyllopteryx taeniolatus]XP_061626287.1 proto-oncogene vav-like isoform X1 [Phyllopteryx taeniolatus]XP_061626288.1 proto-oncogene vav-like isoform X1 [Phyllopteryx taeniolatus]XP_061626289.1 proto-oncogene vav-like isoform X1 [Ph
MELWRQCAKWLIECRVLPETHRVTWEGAQVCDLAQALRDGVLLCQLLNNLLPQAVNLREINLRPQMSQFLCLKNIRTFLVVCQDKFQLKKNELFEAFDLFDVRDFAKVLNTLSILSHSPIAAQRAFQPFPLGGDISDDDIYNGLSDKIDDTVDEADDLYDCVDEEGAEGDEIYEDLMRTVEPETKCGVDKRECCLQEIKQTEGKYSATLESILQHFKKPLGKFLEAQDMESIFVNIQDLASVHREFLDEIQSSVGNGAKNFHHVFVNYKQRLLLYGRYCSQVETATKHLDKLASTREDVRMKLEECSKRANSGRFSLRDLLMVPMQRVLKYPLLLQELVKHTTDPSDKENLRTALDAMRDLAQCVNEVKRDNEILRQITSFQLSIENMSQSLALFGRPKMDGELKISSTEKKSKQERYAFLFDKALFVCKKKSSETFELKEIIELQHYQVRDETAGGKDKRKWSYLFLLLDSYGKCGYDLYFKTRELKKKWLEQFAMAQSNLCPENAAANNHDFQMHNFEETACCKACSMMLRGIFFQGYRCTRCKIAAHKECLGILPTCGRSSDHPGTARKNRTQRSSGNTGIGFPMVEACQEYFGLPPPPASFGHPLYLSKGDVVELTRVEVDLSWWEGRNLTGGQVGWFPCSRVIPFSRRPTPDLSAFSWFAGNMDRPAAKNLLMSRSEGTYLVRQKDGGEFAISIKFSMDIKHIKITSYDGLFRINEKKAFKGLVEMIEFYQQNSLKECVKDVDTTLHMPYKQAEQSNDHRPRAVPKGGGSRTFGMARARYNFSARDRSELSLREGDTIRILSRKGHSGWWKGEVYGKVGFFPSNYVEEDYSDYS